jgi:hypothetical protein
MGITLQNLEKIPLSDMAEANKFAISWVKLQYF